MKYEDAERFFPCDKRRHALEDWNIHPLIGDGGIEMDESAIFCGACASRGKAISKQNADILLGAAVEAKIKSKCEPKPVDEILQETLDSLRYEVRCADAFAYARKLRRKHRKTHREIVEIIEDIWGTKIADLVHDFEDNGYYRHKEAARS